MTKNKAALDRAINEFWEIFWAEHSNLIDNENHLNESLYFEISDKLKEVHEDLCLEIAHNTSPRQLVISADGIDDVFEFVEMVVSNRQNISEKISGWEIIKYRQHRDDIEEQTITVGEHVFELSQILFDLIIDEEVGIVVVMFIPDFDEANDAHEMLRWVILDNTIGEYDAVKKVGYFATYSTAEMKDLDRNMTNEFKTLRHLKKDLDALWQEYIATTN